MKPGIVGLAFFVIGLLLLITFSPLYSPDLAIVPPGPVNLPRFAWLYYLPRVMLTIVLLWISFFILSTEMSRPDKFWASGVIVAVLGSWVFWLQH
ncbi:MAG TPA: hypothetical protein VME69_07175 [Methylocella sp.]|nr:hypothetical protein [Methylocella sp.]